MIITIVNNFENYYYLTSGGSCRNEGCEILKADRERKIVVVSAPGKRYEEDTKVTDLLIQCATSVLNGGSPSPYLEEVLERYASIAKELDLSSDIITNIKKDLLELIESSSDENAFMEAMKASGEDNNAKLVRIF